jgi:hypothetical protein
VHTLFSDSCMMGMLPSEVSEANPRSLPASIQQPSQRLGTGCALQALGNDSMDVQQQIVSKLVLLGEMGSGKSSLVLRYVKGQFFDYQASL